MSGHVVIAGASGFIGGVLSEHFERAGRGVKTIGQDDTADARWGRRNEIADVLEDASLLINLAGKSISARFTDEARDEIVSSRVETNTELRQILVSLENPPPLWLSASAATAYAHTTRTPQTERDQANEQGFAEDVTRALEAALFEGDLPRTRRVAMRLAVVLGDGPATRMLFTLARLGIGGTQYDGSWLGHSRYRPIGAPKGAAASKEPSRGRRTRGRQRFSWIHIADVAGAIDYIEQHPELSGPINFAAPQAVVNAELMRMLRETVGMPIGLPAFRWMLEPAMAVLRTESELVLKSRWVAPGVLTESGYEFRYPKLAPALRAVWRQIRGS